PGALTASAIANDINLQVNTDLSLTNAGQASASREQSANLAEEGFLDPSLFEAISLYDVADGGIRLPADQAEEESFEGEECSDDEEDCVVFNSGDVNYGAPSIR
ncbi:MAG: hypothetical protein MJA83_13870, partial [Gammaproteobacteria bacterium]|nr:hypothetical protein [Gammaproteobacteria bacterium]